jgi:hypothetical protein
MANEDGEKEREAAGSIRELLCGELLDGWETSWKNFDPGLTNSGSKVRLRRSGQ